MPEERSQHRSSVHGQSTVRVSRVYGLTWVVALGSSVTVGLGIYALLGEYISLASRSTYLAYLLSILVVIPIVLTFWERAVSLPGGGGAYQLTRSSGILWHRYFSGWLLLAGYTSALVLLAWGLGLYLKTVILYYELLPNLDDWLITIIGIVIIIGFTAVSRRVDWRQRMIIVLISMAFLLVIVTVSLFDSNTRGTSHMYPAPALTILGATALMMSSFWGIHLVISVRERLQRPTQNMIWALSLPVLLGGLLGALSVLAIGGTGVRAAFLPVPLLGMIDAVDLFSGGFIALVYIVFALGVILLAANGVIIAGARLMEAMSRDGFLPDRVNRLDKASGLSQLMLWISAFFVLALVALLPVQTLIGVSAALFLWSTALLHAPDLFRSKPSLPPKRQIRLPFHPLFPGLTVASGLLIAAALPWQALLTTLAWLVVGGVYYWIYARHGGLASRRELTVVDEEDFTHVADPAEIGSEAATEDAWQFTVLVGVARYETAEARLQLAAKLAAANDGQVLALRIVDLPDYGNQVAWQKVAQREWQSLMEHISHVDYGGIPVRPIVRLASSYSEGILQTVREERADWLLVGWSSSGGKDGDDESRSLLEQLVSYADCHIGILRGTPEEELDQVIVATGGGASAVAGLQFANATTTEDAKLHVVHVIRGVMASDLTEQAKLTMGKTVSDAEMIDDSRVSETIITAPTVVGGIGARFKDADMLVIGASRRDLPERSFYGGLGQQLLEEDERPALLVRSKENSRFLAGRRAIEHIADLLPNLTIERRADVQRQMRSSALPTVDFFVLIILSSIIATLGLLQNSAAVIIGAMLVAPLMSPILAIGMGMTVGQARTIQNGLESTLKGVALAIVVGAVMVIISPIDSPTDEILARTSPNILDLLVALASGAAAGYAISRKEVAAALPGVAIAAALVPPLCVVGYGIGVSQLDIAFGALLLFVTNLIAIIFAAAITFMALGFHPPRAERGELFRTLRITVISLIAIAAVLVLATVTTVRQEQIRNSVEATFEQLIGDSARIIDLTVTRNRGSHTIATTVVSFPNNELEPSALVELESTLEKAVGTPIELELTLITGRLDDLVKIEERTQFVAILAEVMNEHGASVEAVDVTYSLGRYTITATILAYMDHTLTSDLIRTMHEDMSQAVDAPVTLDMTYLEALRGELASPTPTP